MRKLLSAVLLLCAPVCAFGQGATVPFPPAVTQQGNFLSFATITFCSTPTTVNTLGVCQTPVTVFKDQGLTLPYSSAIQTDGIGYFPPNANTATSIWFSPAANLCYTLTTNSMLSPATNPCVPFSVGVQLNGGSLSLNGNITQTQTTAATNVANQSSFLDCMNASYWTGSISATDQWCFQDVLGTGPNPTSTFTLTHGGSPGSSGAATFSTPSAAFTGTNPLTVGFCDKWISPSQNIQTVLNTCTSGGHFFLQQGVYAQGANHITLKSGQVLLGAGEFATVITCTGAGACITLDSTTVAELKDVQIQVDTNAAAIGVDIQNTTADSKWNILEGVQVQTTSGTLTAGQIGFRMMASTNFALYWNTMIACQTLNLDTGWQLTNLGAFATNGVNDNKFISLSAHFFTTGFLIQKFATENQIYSLTGSASGQLANNTLLVVGDGSVASDGNQITGLIADTGTAGQAYVIKANVKHTYMDGVYDTAGRASTNAGSNTIVNGFRNASSQANLLPNGTCTGGAGNPPIGQLAAPSTGLFFSPGGSPETCVLGFPVMSWVTTGPLLGNTMGYGWAAASDPNGTRTTNLGNPAAGIISADTTTVGNGLGSFEGRAFISVGTAAALTGTGACATITTQTGGSSAGRATCTGTTGASTFIITPGTTAPNGWVCEAWDQTTRANLLQQTATVAASCTLTSTSVTQNDVIVFKAVAF